MALNPALHASEQNTSLLIGLNIRRGGEYDFYDDADVAAATGIEDLITAIDAAVTHSSLDAEKEKIKRALRFSKANGDLSDTRVQGATTIEDLVDLTYAENTDSRHLGPALVG